MNIYLLSQTTNTGYDTYDSMVVAANNKNEARNIHPYSFKDYNEENIWDDSYEVWANKPEEVTVTKIGTTTQYNKPTIILTSFNAG